MTGLILSRYEDDSKDITKHILFLKIGLRRKLFF